jgi:hypothetical protein
MAEQNPCYLEKDPSVGVATLLETSRTKCNRLRYSKADRYEEQDAISRKSIAPMKTRSYPLEYHAITKQRHALPTTIAWQKVSHQQPLHFTNLEYRTRGGNIVQLVPPKSLQYASHSNSNSLPSSHSQGISPLPSNPSPCQFSI